MSACVVFVTAFGLFVSFHPAGERAAEWLDDLGSVAVAVTVTAAAARTALRSAGRHGPGGSGWPPPALLGAWVRPSGPGTPSSWPSRYRRPRSPTSSTSSAACPLAAVGVLLLGSQRGERSRAFRFALDGLIIAGSLLFVSWSTALGAVYREDTGSLLSRLVDLAYPVSDIVLTTAALAALSTVRGRRRRELGLIGAGLLAFAVADSAYTYLSYTNNYGNGSVFDTAYIAGYLLLVLAALVPGRRESAPESSRALSAGQTMLPYVPLTFAVVITVGKAVGGARFDGLLVATGAVTVTLVLVRQWLTLMENFRLRQRLEASIVELRSSERELAHQASHDPLTGLANRVLFADRIDQALARHRRHGGVVAVMVCDLDEFKAVNDTLGHLTGDELLRSVAERLLAHVRREDTVARLGGDEFGVLLESFDQPDAAVEAAGRINEAIHPEFLIAGQRVIVTASIGIALVAEGNQTAEQVLRAADIALYEAKGAGRDRCCVYHSHMLADVFARLTLKQDLALLVEHPEQLEIHYQPIMDLTSGDVISVEALARWNHPTRGLLFPDSFIAQAEETGAIVALGSVVLRRACEQLARWRAAGTRCPSISVNISARQLHDPDLLQTVSEVLADCGLPPACLTLEMTESVMLVDLDQAVQRLGALRDLGVKIAVDDFGTGYCSFEYLRRLPVDVLKIDRAFTREIETDTHSAVLVDLMNQLAHSFGLQSVVEGVETPGQMGTVRLLSCDHAQGYFLARPAPAEEITPLLAGRSLYESALRLGLSRVG